LRTAWWLALGSFKQYRGVACGCPLSTMVTPFGVRGVRNMHGYRTVPTSAPHIQADSKACIWKQGPAVRNLPCHKQGYAFTRAFYAHETQSCVFVPRGRVRRRRPAHTAIMQLKCSETRSRKSCSAHRVFLVLRSLVGKSPLGSLQSVSPLRFAADLGHVGPLTLSDRTKHVSFETSSEG
jgi:hypothetical protein